MFRYAHISRLGDPIYNANSVPASPLFAKNTSPECFLNAQSLPEVQVLYIQK